MASLFPVYRVRQVLARSAKEAGEVISRILRLENTIKPVSLTVPLVSSPRLIDDDAESAETQQPKTETQTGGSFIAPSSSLSSIQTNAPYPSNTEKDAVLPEGAFLRASCPGGGGMSNNADVAAALEEGNLVVGTTRLDEAEGWFITDLIGKKIEDRNVFISHHGCEGSNSQRQSSQLEAFVSSLRETGGFYEGKESGKLQLMNNISVIPESNDENLTRREGAERAESCGVHAPQHRLVHFVSNEAEFSSQTEKEEDDVLSVLGNAENDENVQSANDVSSYTVGERYYMVDAGHGWSAYSSLRDLLQFLNQSTRVFGSSPLRSARFLVPIEESEIFLEGLEEIAPYNVKDVLNAATAAAKPIAIALAARYCILQLTEFLVTYGVAAEGSAAAAAAAAAAEAAAATTAAAATNPTTISALCSSMCTVTPWLLVAGGCVFAVVVCVNELKEIKKKIIILPAGEETEREEGGVQFVGVQHCIIKWR